MPDLVRIRNLADEPLRLAFNSQITTVPAKGDALVDREAASAHFGNWWAVPGGKKKWRETEYERIRGLYGCWPGAASTEHMPNWEEVKPKVEIFEMDGTKVSTVIDDPEGKLMPATATDDESNLRQQMAKMQEMMEEMQQKLDTSERIVAAHTAPELPPADSPETAPRRQRREAKIEPSNQAVGE